MLDRLEYERWYRTAARNLSSARRDLEGGEYNWACFKAHQAAEMGVKALLHGLGLPAHGHSVSKLLRQLIDLGLNISIELLDYARDLDKLYVPTRYPNAWVEGEPHEYYSQNDAVKAINEAESILRWVEETWKSLEGESKKEQKS